MDMDKDFRHPTGKFPLGQLVATRGVHESDITTLAIFEVLDRHVNGDWGDLCDEDKESNDSALINDERLVSSYILSEKEGYEGKVYVITEWDRSATTVLFPSEY